MKDGKLVNLGPDPDEPGYYFCAVDENGELSYSGEEEIFEFTAGIPGYAESFNAFWGD
ncbi:hypothetical protein [Oribacterium sp. KHPX15]|uniref:hypothetical protein n=1 Tax=Oribacterium sp. KHPX15 TaxID=1855342 RepID=UPI0015875502|nr:hypothetical protein [Oribacterium sp. KHPX15]